MDQCLHTYKRYLWAVRISAVLLVVIWYRSCCSFCYNDYSTRHSTHPGTPPYSASHKINKAATLQHKAYNSLNYMTASTSHQHHDSDLIAQEDVLHFQPSTTGTSHSRHPTTKSATEHQYNPHTSGRQPTIIHKDNRPPARGFETSIHGNTHLPVYYLSSTHTSQV